jgi:pyruvate dehydrogenase E2 component (dihydrolipoamide acetyltransferase)
MPKLSPTMEEGQLTRWLKKEGDKVSMGEPLAEIDTDKATMEMQALSNGVLRKILINEGESAPLGQPIAIIGEADEDISALLKTALAGKPTQAATAPEKSDESTASAVEATSKDQEPPAALAGTDEKTLQSSATPAGRVLISPIAARMAAEAGIDLNSLRGSGPGGRIVKSDVEAARTQKPATPARKLPAVPRPTQPGTIYGPSAYRDEPLSEMRRTIARRLVTSLGPIPHFFLTSEIDMERAADMRRSINELYPEAKVSINDLIIKVAAVTLIQHPKVNASFQDKTVRYYEHADIGVAVATENGLITPIVRAAELKSLVEIAGESANYDRPWGESSPEEYSGATFSISTRSWHRGICRINPPEAQFLRSARWSLSRSKKTRS